LQQTLLQVRLCCAWLCGLLCLYLRWLLWRNLLCPNLLRGNLLWRRCLTHSLGNLLLQRRGGWCSCWCWLCKLLSNLLW